MAPALPEEAPLAMPQQSLWAPAKTPGRPPTSPRGVGLRRAALLAGTGALTAGGAYQMYLVFKPGGVTIPEALILVLYVALFAWIAFSFASALAGFGSLLLGGARRLGIGAAGPLPALNTRSALLFPTYNEAPARLMSRVEAIHESLARTGAPERFDIFVLSDTTDPDIWIGEEAHFLALRRATGAADRVFYRRRATNEARKAGNIAEWVRRFGSRYEQMIVLDADSLMTGEAIVRLTAAMELNPDVGLIQTLPVIIGGRTLFARAQQFAARVYGPLIAHGLAWWQGAEGNYWGHNAVVRVRAFAQTAGLPALAGRKPFGGHILSHDFVEAALMRRGGWAIHMVPALDGSYEESPPSLTDHAARDRRWCQGNLQHLGVLPARGLHWVSRLHLLTGIGSYVTAPLWLAFLIVGMLVSLQAQFIRPEYFAPGFSLFPQWPAQDPERAAWVFAGTMGLLLAPKLLGFILALARRSMRRGCGGALRGFLSLLVETLISGLAAPVMMSLQSVAVLQVLSGRDAGWSVQRRDDGTLPLAATWRRYRWDTVFGLLLAGAAYAVSLPLFLWMSPVILGLVLSVPLAVITAAPRVGSGLRRRGLLLTPEEADPPDIVRRADALAMSLAETDRAPAPALARLIESPALFELHRGMLPSVPPRGRGAIDADLVVGLAKLEPCDTIAEATAALTAREQVAVLSDPHGLDRLVALWKKEHAA